MASCPRPAAYGCAARGIFDQRACEILTRALESKIVRDMALVEMLAIIDISWQAQG